MICDKINGGGFRMWNSKVNINEILEIRSKTTIYFGVGSIEKIKKIAGELKLKGFNKVIVVTGKSAYLKTGAWNYIEPILREQGIEYILYNSISPNPTVDQIDEAAQIGKTFGAQAVIGIGGGSSIDAAKSAAILLSNPGVSARDIFEYKVFPEKAVPIIAINLTHGTGSETDHFAVASIPEKNYKPAIGYNFIYPLYSIDDPQFMAALSQEQTRYVSVDALNHAIEGATTKTINPYSVLLAIEASRLISEYLPLSLSTPQDLTSRYYLAYASLIAGMSFDNSGLHITHALEHPLSAVKPDLSHGLGLGILLPAVIKQIYPFVPEILASILTSIIPNLKGTEHEVDIAVSGIKNWLTSVGLTLRLSDLGFTKGDVKKLTDLVYETPGLAYMLDIAPLHINREIVEKIYNDSF